MRMSMPPKVLAGLCEFVDLGFVGHVGFACDDASLCVRFVFDVLLGVLGAFVVA